MQCQCCKQHTATIHMTEITDGQRTETHLCEQCAQQHGLAVKSQLPLNELLSSLLAAQGQGEDQPFSDSSDAACPACGMTLRKFGETRLLGCPDDYKVFDGEIRALVEKFQGGSTTHCGKTPSRAPADTKSQLKVMDLRRQLNQAVKNEDYEAAAKLRDQIGQQNETS